MRASFALVALAAVVSASSASKRQLPSCAMECIVSASTGSCQATDNTCLCKSDEFVQSTYQCVQQKCTNPDDLKAAIDGARALCAAAGVTLTQTLPAATSGAATATAPASTSKPAASSASASASATSAPNGAAGPAGVSGMAGALAAVAGFMFAL
ncbi:hypothetical protein FRC08_005740 [Ceratobasidium sp. 394]|nr:hypothetical protein FRC08_005740 [Ceratobasidium sp. 394]KAG9096618.1 hypothetical protein FS749_008096 [Ceratobasidium sp. UAMH 11750]